MGQQKKQKLNVEVSPKAIESQLALWENQSNVF